MEITRRGFIAGAGLGAAYLALESRGLAETPKPGPKRLTLLHVTDTHAQLETHPEYLPGENPTIQSMGGFARLKTALDRERASATGPSFLVDGGDEFQGSGPAAWSEGEIMLDPLNALGFDVFVPGNWEPAYGPARFLDQMRRLKAAVVCYNLHDTRTGARLFAPAVTLERDGVKVAFVGVTDVLASKRQSPAMFAGMDTTRIEGLRKFVQELRRREQPDVAVAVTHTGLTIARQMAREILEFDVVLSGHSHERTAEPILEGHVLVVEPGSMGSFIGRLDLTLRPGGGIADHSFRLIPVLANHYEEDREMKRIVDRVLAPHRERMEEVVARTRTPILRYDVLETSADNLISDAVREAAGADIGLSNGFRFGLPIPPGMVREGDLWNLLPLDARLKVGWVTGAELKRYLEKELELVFSKDPWKLSGGWGPRASGLTMTYAANAAAGRRLLSVKVNGKEVADDGRYRMAGCEREGEPLHVVCRHPGTHNVKVLPATIHQCLLAYCRRHGELAPRREGRAIAVDLPRAVFSQDAVLDHRA
ncbi:MAG: 5'-nucleotidase C-terminal domain-containing protein [Isosphaeraceae bacterium]|nr:5'-nucleotidase C-terminal domain-containing protein [Isosphaeraceae bacterium]